MLRSKKLSNTVSVSLRDSPDALGLSSHPVAGTGEFMIYMITLSSHLRWVLIRDAFAWAGKNARGDLMAP